MDEPLVGGAVIDESGHIWVHESDDALGWICYHDADEEHSEEITYWTWEDVNAASIGELESWDLHLH